MAHPMNKFRQSNVERSRVGSLVGDYKRGGKVHADAEQDKKLIKRMLGKELGEIGGVKARMRADRPHRASGGKVGKKATTVVNVITNGQQQPPVPPPMPPGPPPGAMVPPPPAGPPPGLPPGAGPGMPPGGAPPMPPMRAKGGAVRSKGMDVGTKVQHDKGKNDLKDIGRKRVVTFATGGGVVSFKAGGGRVGRLEAPQGVAPATKLPGGAGGGKGRLAKAREY